MIAKALRQRAYGLAGAVIVVFAAVLGACGDDAATTDAGSDASMCSTGMIGCACDSSECKQGMCVAGICKACALGQAGCLCMSNGGCLEGAVCDSDVCQACEPGDEHCPCANGGCNGDLACLNDVCTSSSCAERTKDCPCAAEGNGERCNDDLYCDPNNTCRDCTSDVFGCPCDADSRCSGGLACDQGKCASKRTCRELVSAGACGVHQQCEDDSDGVGTCTPASCKSGWTWSTAINECTRCSSGDCSSEPTCGASSIMSIAAECAGLSEKCVEDSNGARCEGCVEGAERKNDRCVPSMPCGKGTCEDDEYCDVDAQKCEKLPCPAGQSQDKGGKCSACSTTCSAVGLTGRVWPFRTLVDTCICETVPGYFMPSDQRASPARCDADQDGWVRQEADDGSVRADTALRSNSRCKISKVDGVVLRDEFGTDREIRSCGDGEGLVPADAAGPCTARNPMRLLESERNDVASKMSVEHAPPYDQLAKVGSGGRILQSRELNSLTKACVTANADYNDNGQSDLTEQQARPGGMAGDDDQTRLQSFAYFTELYRAWYEAPTSGDAGKIVIAERSRCAVGDFYLSYWAGDDSSAAFAPNDAPIDLKQPGVLPTPTQAGSNYWRNCERRRDPTYNTEDVGFDFAQWSCASDTGSCASAPPALADLNADTFDHNTTTLSGYGLCGTKGAKPADGSWRGLNHSSQFKCVQIDNGSGVKAPKHNTSEFQKGGKFVLNVCEASMDSRPTHEGSASYEPVLRCAPQEPPTPPDAIDADVRVAWAAVTFKEYTDLNAQTGAPGYQGGCIDEDVDWNDKYDLCRTPVYTLDDDENTSFGRYSCYGEPQNYLWSDTAIETAKLVWGGPDGAANMSVFR
jgi:hypothetical protein